MAGRAGIPVIVGIVEERVRTMDNPHRGEIRGQWQYINMQWRCKRCGVVKGSGHMRDCEYYTGVKYNKGVR